MSLEKSLGRGLESLIPKNNMHVNKNILNINVDQIIPNPRQPRNVFPDSSLIELACSIQEHGIIQPIIVRRRGEVYEIIAGERRWRAAQKAGLKAIPGILKDINDKDSLEASLIENIQRENLNSLDEAEAFENLIAEFNLTQEQISVRVGKSRSLIANTLRLLGLPEEIKLSIRKGEISSGHARAFLSLNSASLQLSAWKEVLLKRLNVRDTESLVLSKSKNVSRETIAGKETKKSSLVNLFYDLTDKMTQALGTKVSIKGKRNRGKIVISYYSQEDLGRISALIINKK